jgi:acetyltransferase
VLSESESKRVLDRYGISSPRGELAGSAGEAADLADSFGYPVVLKAALDGLHHKSDIGGVLLDLRSRAEVTDGFAVLAGRLAQHAARGSAPRVRVEQMVAGSAEVLIGARRDRRFGASLAIGTGGTLVEFLDDVSSRLIPVSRDQIREMIGETRMGTVLNGYRGGKRANVEALITAAESVCALMLDHPAITEVDINPIVYDARLDRWIALDALIVS